MITIAYDAVPAQPEDGGGVGKRSPHGWSWRTKLHLRIGKTLPDLVSVALLRNCSLVPEPDFSHNHGGDKDQQKADYKIEHLPLVSIVIMNEETPIIFYSH